MFTKGLVVVLIVSTFVALIAVASAAPTDNELYKAEFEAYKKQFNKRYTSEAEEVKRFNIFANNIRKIKAHNNNQSNKLSFQLGVNHLTDLTDEEFNRLNGFKLPNKDELLSMSNQMFVKQILEVDDDLVPDQIDWRDANQRVSAVKSQGNCGSCWAFSTVGLLEGQEMTILSNDSSLKYPLQNEFTLSEQDLIDCSKQNKGCGGGMMFYALQDIKEKGGIDYAIDYPYEERAGTCRFSQKRSALTTKQVGYLDNKNEDDLKKLVAIYGPVSAPIHANETLFRDYKSGIYFNENCPNDDGSLDHAILIVGYGVDKLYGDYWIVKNSWSDKWGEKGYVRMARNKNNHCGIANMPTIAKVARY